MSVGAFLAMDNHGMLLRLIALLFLLSVCVFGESESERDSDLVLKKCCPGNSYLNQSIFDPLYECIERENNSVSLYFNSTFVTYRIAKDNQINIPQCGNASIIVEKSYFPVIGSSFVPGDCIDLIGEDLVVLTCNDTQKPVKGVPSANILSIQKCCPELHSFNIVTKECVFEHANESQTQYEEILGSHSFVMTKGSPNCDRDTEVLVEYHSLVHGLSLDRNYLKIRTFNKNSAAELLRPDTFCIEKTTTNMRKPRNITATRRVNASRWIAKACRSRDICQEIPCIRKCCKDGEYISIYKTCVPSPISLKPKFHRFDHRKNDVVLHEPREFGITYKLNCSRYMANQSEISHISGEDGRLYLTELSTPIENDAYCIDYLQTDENVEAEYPGQLGTIICFPEKSLKLAWEHKIYAMCLVISSVLLGITLIIYMCLPKLLNLHGKTLACHVLSLLCGYIALAVIKFNTEEALTYCLLSAYIIYFSFIAAFSWLNVMCFDIFWTFGSMRAPRGMRRSKNFYRFIYYSIYAWGVPLCLTVFTYSAETFRLFPEKYLPCLGQGRCWFFQLSFGHLFYFICPVAIQIIINVVLFILTAIHCNKVKSDINRMQLNSEDKDLPKKKFQADKAKFMMNLKLFLVMGISWLLELIGTFFPEPRQFWYLWDSFNMLQGVFVFIIFVYKKKVLNAIKERLGIKNKSNNNNKGKTTMGATTTTMLTNGSTTPGMELSGRYKSTEKLESPLMQRNRLSP